MNAAAIVNAHAATGLARYRWPRAARMLARRLGHVEVRFTRRAGDATVLARELASAGFDPLIAAGGDGTLNEVVNGLLEVQSGARVGVLPIASGGDFARALGLKGMRAAVDALAAGYSRQVDVVRARFQGRDGPDSPGGEAVRHFVNVASIGLGGLVTADVLGNWRFLPGRVRYLAATIPRLAAGCVYRLRLWLDDAGAGAFDATIVSLANGRYQGGGILIAPAAAMDDGFMDITLVEEVGLREVLRNMRLLYDGNLHAYPKVRHWRARRVRVEGQAAPLELDGEPLGRVPIEAEVVPRALRLICPEPERR